MTTNFILYFVVLFIVSSTEACGSSIKDLNETEYDRMPPLLHLDDYRRCLNEEQGVYCLAKFILHGEPGNQLIKLIEEYSSDYRTRFNHSYVERGVCVKKSCNHLLRNKNLNDSDVVRGILEVCVNESIYKDYGLQARIDKVYSCDRKIVNPIIEKDLSDRLVDGYFIILIAFVLAGTLYDALVLKEGKENKNYEGNKYLLCFSAIRNWNRLVSWNQEEQNTNSLQFIHGVKCVVSFFVVYTHSFFLFALISDDSREYEMIKNKPYTLLFNGLPLIQIYFLLSGILLVVVMRKIERVQRISWSMFPLLFLGRWLRLVVPLISVFGQSVTLFRYSGSGPLWDHVAMSHVSICRKYWWAHLLFINNLIPEDIGCMFQTWSLAVEMQLSAMGLVLYLATIDRPRTRNIILAVMILLGLVIPALHVWLGDYDATVAGNPEFLRSIASAETNPTFSYMHIRTQNNILFYFIGMSLGYMFDHCQRTKSSYRWNKQLCNVLVWSCIPGLLTLTWINTWFHGSDLYSRVVYAAVFRAAMAVFCVGAGFSMLMKWDETWLRKFFEWHGWVLPSQLSYLVFLLHNGVIATIVANARQMVQFSFLHTLILQFGVMGITLLAALPMYLLVEGPMTGLLKCFMAGNHQSSKEKKKN